MNGATMSEIDTVIQCEICTCPAIQVSPDDKDILSDYIGEGETLYFTCCEYCGYNGNATRISDKHDNTIIILIEE